MYIWCARTFFPRPQDAQHWFIHNFSSARSSSVPEFLNSPGLCLVPPTPSVIWAHWYRHTTQSLVLELGHRSCFSLLWKIYISRRRRPDATHLDGFCPGRVWLTCSCFIFIRRCQATQGFCSQTCQKHSSDIVRTGLRVEKGSRRTSEARLDVTSVVWNGLYQLRQS